MTGKSREQWGSRIGFVLAAAGSAVGLGNIWKFPYMTGTNGGAAFVFIYILMVAAVGFTVMLAEFSIGRLGAHNVVDCFARVRSSKWSPIGWMGLICGIVILSYYSVIGGWTIRYFWLSFLDLMETAALGKAGEAFGGFVSNAPMVAGYQALFMLVTILVVLKGVSSGIERACKILMPALFILMLVLMARAMTLPGAMKGIEFYLKPDFSKVTASTILAAMGQAFFSLSLAAGTLITYGSYLDKKASLVRSVWQICSIDTLVALLAGFIIFPAVFAFNVEPSAGPGLTFISLPGVFAQMPAGFLWSMLFFCLLFFAALTSSISILETPVAYLMDHGWSRRSASCVMGLVIFLLGLPSAFSLDGSLKIAGKDFLDAACYLTDSILMPLGGVLICIFTGWVIHAKVRAIFEEPEQKFAGYPLWLFFVRVVAPVGILWIFSAGLKW